MTEGDGEDDSGEDQTHEFLDPIDTDEFENVVDALQYNMEGVEVLVDVPGSKRFSNESTHRASVRSRQINSLKGQAVGGSASWVAGGCASFPSQHEVMKLSPRSQGCRQLRQRSIQRAQSQ